MSLSIKVKIEGDEIVQRKLKALGTSVNHMPDAMKEIGELLVKYYGTVGFSDKGRPYGSAWPQLSTKYRKLKEKKYPGRGMLIATGTMMDSFFAKSNSTSVVIDNSTKYYKYHQSSAPRKSNLPRRQMAGINGKLKADIREIIRNEISKKLAKA